MTARLVDRAGYPNILVVVLDTLRADAAEPYGAAAGSSPALAELARRGAAVSGVRATASWTLPSHFSMFTGQLARGFGLGQAPAGTPQSAAPVVKKQRDRFLPEILRRAGYATAGASANMWVGKQAGFGTGFERFDEFDTSRQNVLGGSLRHRLKWDWEGARARTDDGAAHAEQVVNGWIKDLDNRPFFWFVNLLECHSPYLPPKPYDHASMLTRLRAADEAHRYLNFSAILRACLGMLTIPADAVGRMRDLYAASLRYVDDWVTRVLESLRDCGVLDDTLVIVCSDHGENLGEGGLFAHTLSVDDRLLAVPFVAAGPGHKEFDGMQSLAEMPQRVANAIGLEEHPWDPGLIHGLPVAQWDSLASPSHPRVMKFIEEFRIDEEGVLVLTSPLTCAVSGRFKLVRGAHETDEKLYDLEADPLELAPLRDEEEMVGRAGDALATLRAAVRDPAAQATHTDDSTSEEATTDEAVSEDELADIERRMRLMGYM